MDEKPMTVSIHHPTYTVLYPRHVRFNIHCIQNSLSRLFLLPRDGVPYFFRCNYCSFKFKEVLLEWLLVQGGILP